MMEFVYGYSFGGCMNPGKADFAVSHRYQAFGCRSNLNCAIASFSLIEIYRLPSRTFTVSPTHSTPTQRHASSPSFRAPPSHSRSSRKPSSRHRHRHAEARQQRRSAGQVGIDFQTSRGEEAIRQEAIREETTREEAGTDAGSKTRTCTRTRSSSRTSTSTSTSS